MLLLVNGKELGGMNGTLAFVRRCFTVSALGLALVSTTTPQVGLAFRQPQQRPLPAAGSLWRTASFPLENFQGYTSPYGPRHNPFGAPTGEYHGGLDMAAPMGSYIRNWWTGRVLEVSDHTGCGTMIRVQSGPWVHSYCHMQGTVERDNRGLVLIDRAGGIFLREGQAVTAGARIGRVGMTGRTTGPHLCWRLKHNGNPVNPALVLRAMYAARRG
jgi:murein DD-endopeptidase MepM/ murein hydrolase activator NlpD